MNDPTRHDTREPDEPPGLPAQDNADSGLTELLAGVMFIGIGVLALFLGRDYPMGSALDMGPGYIPRIIAVALVGLGAIGVVRGILSGDRTWPVLPVWPMLWISLSIVTFALLIDRIGLFFTCIVVALIAMLALPRPRWREVPVVAVTLAVFSTLLFGYALGLPLPMWPQ